MAYRTDGSSALKDDNLFELDNSDAVKSETKIINLDDYRKKKSIVEEKIENVAGESTKNLKGNDDLKNEIKSEIRSIINEEKIQTSKEEINNLAEVISKKLGIENNSETKIEAKKIKIEIDKWKEENIKEVNDFKKEEFVNKFEEETRKLNPELKEEELVYVKKYAEEISEIYSNKNEIDVCKNDILEANNQFSPGQLENGFTDLKGVVEFLKKSPEQIKGIKEKYDSVKSGLKDVNLPNLKEVRSFENVISGLKGSAGNFLFSKTQNFLGGFDRLDKLTGGWLNKTVTDAGMKMASKIGNQAFGEFAKNSLGVFAKQGFQQGFGTVFNGILSGGVKAVASTGGKAAVGGLISKIGTGPMGWLVAAGGIILNPILDKAKNFLEDSFGKKIGGLLNSGLNLGSSFLATTKLGGLLGIGGAGAAAGTTAAGATAAGAGAAAAATAGAPVVGIVIVCVIVGLFFYNIFQGFLTSSLLPAKGDYSQELTDYGGGGSVVNYGRYTGVVDSYIENGLIFSVFEEGSQGGRLGQSYDLGRDDRANLGEINGFQLDKRVIEPYKAMVNKARADGIPASELGLISGYRDIESQTILWNQKTAEYRENNPSWTEDMITQYARIWVATPGGSPHHTGRAIDIFVCGGTNACGGIDNQKKSETFNWLQLNAANFGFYNYPVEPWHWEYNPIDKNSNNSAIGL